MTFGLDGMVLLAARRPCRLLAVVLQVDYVGYVGLPCTNTYAPFCLFAALMIRARPPDAEVV
jgi:hypothetical protein